MSAKHRRLWVCPDCEKVEERHHSATKRPFCDECESRHGVLIEMKPKGKDAGKFYDSEGYARNVPTDGGSDV